MMKLTAFVSMVLMKVMNAQGPDIDELCPEPEWVIYNPNELGDPYDMCPERQCKKCFHIATDETDVAPTKPVKMTYDECATYCEDKWDAPVACVANKCQNMFLVDEVLNSETYVNAPGNNGVLFDTFWIGFDDMDEEGKFEWPQQCPGWRGYEIGPNGYAPWAMDEPMGGVMENCAEVTYPVTSPEKGTWADAPCGDENICVCSREVGTDCPKGKNLCIFDNQDGTQIPGVPSFRINNVANSGDQITVAANEVVTVVLEYGNAMQQPAELRGFDVGCKLSNPDEFFLGDPKRNLQKFFRGGLFFEDDCFTAECLKPMIGGQFRNIRFPVTTNPDTVFIGSTTLVNCCFYDGKMYPDPFEGPEDDCMGEFASMNITIRDC